MSGSGRQIVFVVDGGVGERYLEVGTVQDLAERVRGANLGDYHITGVYGLNRLNELKPLDWTVQGAHDFDEEQWAVAVVTVVFPDGHLEQGNFVVDGRS